MLERLICKIKGYTVGTEKYIIEKSAFDELMGICEKQTAYLEAIQKNEIIVMRKEAGELAELFAKFKERIKG